MIHTSNNIKCPLQQRYLTLFLKIYLVEDFSSNHNLAHCLIRLGSDWSVKTDVLEFGWRRNPHWFRHYRASWNMTWNNRKWRPIFFFWQNWEINNTTKSIPETLWTVRWAASNTDVPLQLGLVSLSLSLIVIQPFHTCFWWAAGNPKFCGTFITSALLTALCSDCVLSHEPLCVGVIMLANACV